MSINPALLVSAKIMQNYFVDKVTGLPLCGGLIYMYKDTDQQVLKNWYYQIGVPGNYQYQALPNPLRLSASGTIIDINGYQVIPLYYPFSEQDETQPENYYVRVYNYQNAFQFDIYNFPQTPLTSGSESSGNSLKNLIINNNFWRNIGYNGNPSNTTTQVNLSSATSMVVSPSNHDGFAFPDIQFIKNNTSATDYCNFLTFPAGTDPLNNLGPGLVTPEYYLNHVCTVAGIGETIKVYQFPISLHLYNFENQTATFTICAQNVSGPATSINIYYYQFLGTNSTAQMTPAPTQIGNSLFLSNAWTYYPITFTIPTSAALSLSGTGDDSFYIQVGIPTNATCNISFAIPSLFLGNLPATKDFSTYDMIDRIINSWRTGDYRTSLNSSLPGWVPCNDGSIGNYSSPATTRANIDTWPLYNLIWTNVTNTYAPMADTNPRGSSAYADFTSNRALTLTETLGRVIAGIWNNSPQVLGFTVGSDTTTLTTTQLPAHTHDFAYSDTGVPVSATVSSNLSPGGHPPLGSSGTDSAAVVIASAGSGQAYNSQPKTVYCNIFLKL